jgi:hypothetical protein
LAVLPGGYFCAIEVKRSRNKTTDAQQAFLDDVEARGGVAIVVHSVEEVEDRLLPFIRKERANT